ncbi:CdaR family transcriptional regulator [Metabacillus iocasae]|uniref:Carbohydrate diacid regulator n=1 Tax=Priestia iocasae TaxID=2291674 RepID=A0ABS2QZ71_9BACI|nr:carbohydrate diacid regulator [Metabacillus iocasae]
MLLLPSLAQKIMYEVKKLLDEDIIIVDTNGSIVASTDEKRVGAFHEGALLSIKERRTVVITKGDTNALKGVKPGVNLPIFFSHDVIGVIGITGNPDQILPYGQLLRKMTELLIQDNYYNEQHEWRSRMLEAFVFDWLHLKDWTAAFLERAKLLQINLEPKRQILLLYFHHNRTLAQKDIWQLHPFLNEQDVIIRWGNDRLLIVQTVDEHTTTDLTLQKIKKMKAFMEDTWHLCTSLGAGQPVLSDQLLHSYEQAERALTVAMKHNRIVFDEELRLEMCLKDISAETKRDFIQRVLGSIIEDVELISTFQAYFDENMSLKATAEALHIHINTLHYRIKKLEQRTKLNLKSSSDVVSLYLALQFLDESTKIN